MNDWPACEIELKPLSELKPYARNARTHSDEQVGQIVRSIKEFGWTNPILIDEAGTIIAGHGRVMAAERLGLSKVPTMTALGWSDEQKRAYVLADNKLALNAGWDLEALKFELGELEAVNFDLSLTGFGEDEIEKLFDDISPELAKNYSRKIEAPVYRPTGKCPKIAELYDKTKADELRAEIDAADISDEVREFLMAAAERHIVFNFRNIAEFYAHSVPEIQDLMERSALVIIDYRKAVEQGFVKLAEGMMEQAEGSKARNYA